MADIINTALRSAFMIYWTDVGGMEPQLTRSPFTRNAHVGVYRNGGEGFANYYGNAADMVVGPAQQLVVNIKKAGKF
ncbi:MAG: hypothetical protein LBS32_06080 [Clostridiales Family XIII bacterium]|jgi:hypothetical protein|nr:hypothetical protein [Clostridiales Family XIII bacterium]